MQENTVNNFIIIDLETQIKWTNFIKDTNYKKRANKR